MFLTPIFLDFSGDFSTFSHFGPPGSDFCDFWVFSIFPIFAIFFHDFAHSQYFVSCFCLAVLF